MRVQGLKLQAELQQLQTNQFTFNPAPHLEPIFGLEPQPQQSLDEPEEVQIQTGPNVIGNLHEQEQRKKPRPDETPRMKSRAQRREEEQLAKQLRDASLEEEDME